MHCVMARGLYLRANGRLPCYCSAGETVTLGQVTPRAMPEDFFDTVFDGPGFAHVRRSMADAARKHAPLRERGLAVWNSSSCPRAWSPSPSDLAGFAGISSPLSSGWGASDSSSGRLDQPTDRPDQRPFGTLCGPRGVFTPPPRMLPFPAPGSAALTGL